MKRILPLMIIAGLLLTGCDQYATYTPSAVDLTALAENYQGDDKPAIQGTAVARYLTAEAGRAASEQAAAEIVKLEATRQAGLAAERRQFVAMTAEAQATRDTLSAQATRQAMDVLATQQAHTYQATATAEVIQVTAQALAIQATATVEARNWQATLTAEALAREATATAQHKADLATATQQAKDDRATATQQSIDATSGAVHATMTRQAEKREAVLGYGRDYGIPLVLLAVAGGLGVLIWYGIQEYKKRPVVYPRNFLGDAEPMATPVDGGGHVFLDLDRQPGAAIRVLPSGEVAAPELRSPEQEERTTARDQMVDAMTRPKLGAGHRATPSMTMLPPSNPAIRILPSDQVRPWIEDVEAQLLEDVDSA